MTAVPAKLQRCETGWRYEVGEVRGWNLTRQGAEAQIRKLKDRYKLIYHGKLHFHYGRPGK